MAARDDPDALLATMEKVYETVLRRLVTVHEVVAVVHVRASGLDVTVYPVGAGPAAGAVHDTVAVVSPADAVAAVGGFGTPDGVTALDALDQSEIPAALDAPTLNT